MTTRSPRSSARKRHESKHDDPCTLYARAVCRGDITAGELVRLACKRHLDDLVSGKDRDLYFDEVDAQEAYDFFALLCHSKGQWAGQPFRLEPWQYFVVGSIFGWKRADGTRRFRVAHVEVARKNGKTTLAAGIGLYLLVLDDEAGAEVYTVATKRDQARLAHDESKRMVKASPALRRHVKPFKDALTVETSDSKYVPLGADADTLDGLNIHGAICDELHAWKLRDLWDVIETATGARRQPLMFPITTAGVGRSGIWWERRDLAVKVLQGVVPDDGLFAAIYTLDEGDDWTSEKHWLKANPSLGVSLRVEELRERCREAIATPGKQNAFKRLRLNIPTQQVTLWLDLARWDKCAGDDLTWEALKGRECYSGLDLSATTDMTALAHVFPPRDDRERWKALLRYWLPGADLAERCRRDHAPYDLWSQQNWLSLTEGDVVDYDFVEACIVEDAGYFRMQTLAIDRWGSNQLTTRLKDHHGLPVEGFGQGFASMAAPCKELEILVTSARFAHGQHPVLRFNVACAAVKQDPAGNRKPDKVTSTGRIDGLVAVLMGLGAALVAPQLGSVYDHRGMEVLGTTEPKASAQPDVWQDDSDDD